MISEGRYKKIASEKDLSLFETAGFSMWPFLRPGERLLVKEVPMKDLKIGDIILYLRDEQKVCHRLVKKIKEGERLLFYARGDNSLPCPECVTEQMYTGKVIGALKNGKIVDFTSRKYLFINRAIVLIAPIVSWTNRIAKPLYDRFLIKEGA